ncbi:MAG: hypothetical protein K2Q09_04830 [Phycisphaerales bacterium]|nr:hypothetical protein [Phycisphaerales bacterium]
MTLNRITCAMLAVAAGSGIGIATALAQPPATPAPAAGAANGQLAPAKSGRENLARLQKTISVDMKEWKLEDAIKHLANETEATIDPVWKSGSDDGLDPEVLVTFSAKGLDGVTVLEKLLERASGDAITSDDKATWQVTSYGTLQIGPRKVLNRSRRVEVYDVSDMLFEVPVYDDVPMIDLAQVLRSSGGGRGSGGGGGGGQSIFGNGGGNRNGGNQQRQEERKRRRVELADELKRLLTSLAEKDQWEDNGGNGGSMTVYQGNIIVDAPDYMHRAVAGYAWWPSAKQTQVKGRRYVSMSGNVEAAKVIGLTPFQEAGGTGNR